ncbi:ADP-ribosylglycohydrolase family protein [Actinomadura darangshiensis]|uniref:ADP-ribosylglycohydrolase family protein n=1 Tax=Actinomadura darangshiensis TaxID=705336 RepID=A0A4R5BXQ0_9ACTN|nr:ADP-ribosylglycohydrolase family protein [Actinomadura darangshiensis]TDD90170.1 ADP-ribosylglycohydrolase family protein [Actinomadura darangshiensis]
MPLTTDERAARAKGSLAGLSVGDAFGDQFFLLANRHVPATTGVPPAPWNWSDDTEMACSVMDVLNRFGQIDQGALVKAFAGRMDVGRGYGAGAFELLERVRGGDHWRRASSELFDGKGSFGNGAAMRVAPLGAYFSDDLERAASEAALSAEVTHANPEGVAGAVAVAVATAYVASHDRVTPKAVIGAALDLTTTGQYVRRGLKRALRLLAKSPQEAAHELGNGSRITAQDTVPYALWAAATRLTDYEAAVRACAMVGGDMDTTAAMTGGIVAAHLGPDAVPAAWLQAREPLPHWLEGAEKPLGTAD